MASPDRDGEANELREVVLRCVRIPGAAALVGAIITIGNTPGTIANYVNADGGGIVLAESDDPTEGYANQLHYQQWMEFETKVMLKLEDAVPLIGAYLG